MKCPDCNGSGDRDGWRCERCPKCEGTGKVAYVVPPAVDFDDAPTQPDIKVTIARAKIEIYDDRLDDTMYDSAPRCSDCGGTDIAPFELNGAMRRHCWDCGKVSAREGHTL